MDATKALRRNSSIGLSLLTENSFVSKIVQSSGQFIPRQVLYKAEEKDENAVTMPPYRPFVGRGAAAAFEALRHDFYVRKHEEKSSSPSSGGRQSQEVPKDRRMSSLGFAGAEETNPRSFRPTKITSDQEFEMLKLHYLNLMKEMQETALMLNLYEQHQLLMRQRERDVSEMKSKRSNVPHFICSSNDTSSSEKRRIMNTVPLANKRQKKS